MESLIPELEGFTPRPSTASTLRAHIPIDPALASSSSNPYGQQREYWDEDRYDDQDDYSSSDLGAGRGGRDGDGEDEDDSSEEETDAEDEFAASSSAQAGQKRGRQSTGRGGLVREDGTVLPMGSLKGKEKAVDQDAGDGELFDADEEETGAAELSRLIEAVRDSNSTGIGGATALDKEFDRSIAYELDGFDPDLLNDMSVGIKGRKKKRGGKGRRAAADVEPSPEVKRLLGQANQAYSEGRLIEAIELLSEVVRIDPIIRASWYTLATIYEELEEKEKAVQCKIVATHLMGAKQAAGDWVQLGRESRDLGLLHQAIYCFTQAVKANKEDVDAMWDRAILLKLSGATGMAIRAFLALLSLLPHDPGVLREVAPLLHSTHQFAQATTLLLSAFAFYRSTVPLVTSSTIDLLNTYGYADLETLTDFLLEKKDYAETVRVIRQGVRWLQGRERETGWDAMEDDREYDEVRKTREGWEKANTYFEEEGTYELDVRLRCRLGLARLGMGRVQEAQRHFEILYAEEAAHFPELFGAVGQAFFDRKMYAEALDVYQFMAENEDTNGPTVWFKIAQCHAASGDWEDAKDCYEHVIEEEPDNLDAKLALAKVLEQLSEPSRALELIKEVISLRETRAAAEPTRRRRTVPATREERAAAATNRVSAEAARHAEFTLAFSQLADLDGRVHQGDDEAVNQWLEIATTLVESFRSTKQLFPSDFRKRFTGMTGGRNAWRRRGRKGKGGTGEDKERDLEVDAAQMQDRLQQALNTEDQNEVEETTFRGLDFDAWVDFILRYCFLLAISDEIELAAEVLLHVREASVMRQSQSRTEALRLGLLTVYHHANLTTPLVAELRYFLRTYPSQTEPLRLLLSLLSQGTAAVEGLNDTRLQKYFSRQLGMINRDAVGSTGTSGGGATSSQGGASQRPSLSPQPSRKSVPRASSAPASEGVEGDDEEDEGERLAGDFANAASAFKPSKLSPLFFAVYGFMLNNSQSHQPAIIYLIRAYELDKNQPLVNLTLATAYLQRAMSRKTDNRQHQIAQAFAFLEQYRRLRGPCQETEYNLARAFHHLGLHGHAVKHYESVLSMPPPAPSAAAMAVDDLDPSLASSAPEHKEDKFATLDYRKVAAYNLVTLYAMTGSAELAKAVAERWLAV
ncbi:hypothetical protein JCM8547_009077 [Rhodosporidiobolus lusitaniae]